MGAEILDSRTCIADREFQAWMATVGILKQSTDKLANLPLINNNNHDKPRGIATKFLQLLQDNPGFIVSQDEAALHLYGSTGEKERRWVGIWSNHIENHLGDADLLGRYKGLGWALGIEEFLLTQGQVSVVYRLWRDLGQDVSIGDLTTAVYGSDDVGARKNIIFNHLVNLRNQCLPRTKAAIGHTGSLSVGAAESGDLYLRLFEKPDEIKKPDELPDSRFPNHLKLAFQDWLVRIGLVHRFPNVQFLALPVALTKTEVRLIRVLQEFPGYLVPFEFIAEEIYGHPEDGPKLNSHLKTVRRKMDKPELVHTVPLLGIGLGVKDFDVPPMPLDILSRLRAVGSKPIPITEISEGFYDYHNDNTLQNIQRAVSDLRKLLQNSEYKIVTHNRKSTNKELAYSLARKPSKNSS